MADIPLVSRDTRSTTLVLGMLFLYSVAMFTLPFIAYFAVHHILTDYYPVENFVRTVWSVVAAVFVVNLIIFAYAYKAYHEKEYDEHGNEIDQHAYPPPEPDKSGLNLKED